MKSRLALLCLMSATLYGADVRTASSRGPADMQVIMALTRTPAGFDVYWIHENEFVTPLHTRLLRTSFSAEPAMVEATRLVRDFDSTVAVMAIDASGDNPPLLVWKANDRAYISPLLNGALKYPAGAQLPFMGFELQGMTCGTGRCFLTTRSSSGPTIATPIDSNGAIAGASVQLPFVWTEWRDQSIVGTNSIFAIYKSLSGDIHAANTDLNGNLLFDRLVLSNAPYSSTAVDFDGERFTVAWVRSAPGGWGGGDASTTIEAAAISLDGTVTPLPPLQTLAPGTPEMYDQIALAWNGTNHLLVYIDAALDGNRLKFVRLGRDLRPLDAAPVDLASGLPFGERSIILQLADGYAVAWEYPNMNVAVVTNDGSVRGTLRFGESPARRRAVR